MRHKTVLVIGAGITRAAHKPGLRIPDLPPPLDRDFFRLTSKLHSSDHDDFVIKLKELYRQDSDELLTSLERAFSSIWQKAIEIPDWKDSGENPYSDLALKLVELITRVLAQTSNEMDIAKDSEIYRLIEAEIEFGDLTILTFNYDLLLENVLDRIATDFRREHPRWSQVFCYPGCYCLSNMIGTFPGHYRYEFDSQVPFVNLSGEHKGVRLLKLHGSSSWAHLVLTKDDFRQRMTGRGFGGVYVVNSRNVLWNPPQWMDRGNLITLAPAIIPPISAKEQLLRMNAFAGVWKEAEIRLKEATRITLAGYSFPPTDVEACRLLRDHTPNLNFINVLNPDESICKRVEEIFSCEVSAHFQSITDYLRRFSQRF